MLSASSIHHSPDGDSHELMAGSEAERGQDSLRDEADERTAGPEHDPNESECSMYAAEPQRAAQPATLSRITRARPIEAIAPEAVRPASAAEPQELSEATILGSIQRAQARVNDAREANDELANVLESMRRGFVERQLSLEKRVHALTAERQRLLSEIEQISHEAAQNRGFLIAEQDRFLSGILDEHEREVRTLLDQRDQARLQLQQLAHDVQSVPPFDIAGSTSHPGANAGPELEHARRMIAKLLVERDRASELLRRLHAQRDEAQSRADRLLIERDRVYGDLLTLQAERSGARRTMPNSRPPESLPPYTEDADEAPAPSFPDSGAQHSFPGVVRLGQPRSWTDGDDAAPAPTPPSKDPLVEVTFPTEATSPLRQKPNPASVRLGGYSMSSEELSRQEIPREPHAGPEPRDND